MSGHLPGRIGSLAAASLSVLVVACGGSPSAPEKEKSGDAGKEVATATSAVDVGGMDKLVAAAKKEGKLNVIALPPDWSNYGEVISAFEKKYGIKVNSAQPDAASQDEINAAKQLKGQDRAPDVFDLGASVALANTSMYAPYKVQAFEDIPSNLKEPTGLWVSDYTGYMSIGYNADEVPAPTKVEDLLKPEYKGKVALNGDPTQAAAGYHGVIMAALANGGSPDDISAGVEFFKKLKKAGNLVPVDPTPATIASGQTPVVIDWDYVNAAQTKELEGKVKWEVMVPQEAIHGAYYNQAINKDAPNPAAARLWQEFLYSPEGHNLWLKGFARPVLMEKMAKDGTIDKAAYDALPEAKGEPAILTEEQITAAQEYLKKNWAKAVG